jgi:beta-N-acetylhexosaminidase
MHPTLDLGEIERKIGRVFMIGLPGPYVDDETEALIREHCLGGVILFARNIVDPIQLTELCNALQQKALESHGIPLFLSVDQEGGPVARLGEPFTLFPGNAAIGGDPEGEVKAAEFARITAEEMALVGLNMNLAPVVDVQSGEPERHLAGRIFSRDAEKVARLGRIVIEGLQDRGVVAVAKHFPGLGGTRLDPHEELPSIDADRDLLERVHLHPFREALAAGVGGVMSSHAIYPALDPDRPATLSQAIMSRHLRERLGFKGLVITDDLEMGAIQKTWGVAEGALEAFKAGADILLICNDRETVLECMDRMRQGLLRGEIGFERLHESLERIRQVKHRFLDSTGAVSIEDVRTYFGL